MSGARTLLVGGNDVFIDAVVDWLERDPQLEVVGRAHSGAEAMSRVAALGVELVLVDVSLPDMSGFEAVRRIKDAASAPLVILLSFFDSRAARLEAMAVGADGFVVTSEMAECLTPLVGDLLRRRKSGARKKSSVVSFKRVRPTDLSE